MYIKPINTKDLSPVLKEFIKKVGLMAYPNYKGRKFELHFQSSYQMEAYWSGGSKTYSVAINLDTLSMAAPNADTSNPWKAIAHKRFEIPMGVAIIEHVIFCGKDLGIRLVIRPDETKVIGYVPSLPNVSEVLAIE